MDEEQVVVRGEKKKREDWGGPGDYNKRRGDEGRSASPTGKTAELRSLVFSSVIISNAYKLRFRLHPPARPSLIAPVLDLTQNCDCPFPCFG